MKPNIVLACELEGQAVILHVILSDENAHTAARKEFHRLRYLLLRRIVAAHTRCVARAVQLVSYIRDILLALCALKESRYALKVQKLVLPKLYLLGEHLLCVFELVILLVHSLRVCRGGKTPVKLYSDRGTVFVVIVLGYERGVALFNSVNIGGDKVSRAFNILCARTVGKGSSLYIELSLGARESGVQEHFYVPCSVGYLLYSVPLGKIEVKERRERIKVLIRYTVSEIAYIHIGIVNGLSASVYRDGGSIALAREKLTPLGENSEQFVFINFRERNVCTPARSVTKLPCNLRCNARVNRRDELLDGALLFESSYLFFKALARNLGRYKLIRHSRYLIFKSRQHLTDARRRKVDYLERRQHLIFGIKQNEVCVLSHYLAYELHFRRKSHLVVSRYYELRDSVKTGLSNSHDLRARQPLSQKHTEHRRLKGIFFRRIADLQSRRIRSDVEDKTARALSVMYNKIYLIAKRLEYLLDFRLRKLFAKFREHGAHHTSVKCHIYPLSYIADLKLRFKIGNRAAGIRALIAAHQNL